MQQSDTVTKIIPAIIKVMSEVESIDKNLEVGAGTRSAYKGVADKDVKLAIGKSMQSNGLVIVPTKITPKVTIDSWEKDGQYGIERKQSVFTEVETEYRLFHTSGEWIDLVGYGHGVDSQDKSAGKATTYALKNALLYSFLVPTGNIDDTDSTHSDSLPQKPATARTATTQRSGLTMPCPIHKVEMREAISKKTGRPYFYHKHGDEYCYGKVKQETKPAALAQQTNDSYGDISQDIPF